MHNKISNLLKKRSTEIMNLWHERAIVEIQAAHFQKTLALRNSLPIYLSQLADALSTTINRTSARKRFDKDASTRIGQKHGKERAASRHYTMDQMILEYHILRQVIFDVLERDYKLSTIELEVIICSVEQAVNDAATQFTETLRNIQEQLSRTLAHDLRTPITAAKMNAQMIIRKADADIFYVDKARRINGSMDRLDMMICDLLDVSRLRSGESLPLEFKEFDFEMIVKEIVIELNYENPNSAILNSSGPCLGSWNENGIRRLIENLANNAIKYGKEKTPITLNLSQDEEKIILEVHNEGEPIPLEDQSLLFEQYKRAKSAESKVGWGLGLAMVKGMVEGHKGSIRVDSEAGKGTSF
ncbi:MAG: sensor histidine kinase, partial [Bdellovibrionales bacterium]|nr:sensor histidine kinase [Bdellovibrionales bacterium]